MERVPILARAGPRANMRYLQISAADRGLDVRCVASNFDLAVGVRDCEPCSVAGKHRSMLMIGALH